MNLKHKHIIAYLKTARVFADCSTASRLHVGAICVKHDRIISIGYNGTPAGWSNKCEDEQGKTLPYVLHAEANCLIKLARTGGEAAFDSVMFCTHSPCMECSKMIYAAGIQKVYYIEQYRSMDGIEFLQTCGIECIQQSIDS
jgi:dCMP deaminase